MWLYSGSTSRLITRLMKGEGDPANSLSALPPLGVTVELAPVLGNPTQTRSANRLPVQHGWNMLKVSTGKCAMNVLNKNSGKGWMMDSIELVFYTLSHIFLSASVDVGECLSLCEPSYINLIFSVKVTEFGWICMVSTSFFWHFYYMHSLPRSRCVCVCAAVM